MKLYSLTTKSYEGVSTEWFPSKAKALARSREHKDIPDDDGDVYEVGDIEQHTFGLTRKHMIAFLNSITLGQEY